MNKLFLVTAVVSGLVMAGLVESFEFHETELETEEKLWDLYERWQSHHAVSRSAEEKLKRFSVFKANARHVNDFNKMERPYKIGLNTFGDMDDDELRGKFSGVEVNQNQSNFVYEDVKAVPVPASMDWRTYGAVTPVKHQGYECGWYRQNAFQYIRNRGITTTQRYPYAGKVGTCVAQTPAVWIYGYANVQANNEGAMLRAVAQQPISVSMDSSSIMRYSQGVFTGPCNTVHNHAVLIVGYGTTSNGIKYWIVKNSWGLDWGEKGYFRIQRGFRQKQGLCGIAMYPMIPIKRSALKSPLRRLRIYNIF